MKFFILLVLSVMVAFFLGPFFPYWGIMLCIAIVSALVGGTGTGSFFSAALAVWAVWLLVPFFIISKTESELPTKIGQIMGFGHAHLLVWATSLIGFLIGGFSALTGNRLRKLFEKEKIHY